MIHLMGLEGQFWALLKGDHVMTPTTTMILKKCDENMLSPL
jgi:hypothetical protein